MVDGRVFGILLAVWQAASPGVATAEVIHLKAKQGKLDDVIAELEAGVPIDLPATNYVSVKGVSPLFVAAQFGQADVVAVLLARGADPTLSFGSTEGDSVPVGTPLHAAAGNGHEDVVRLLIDAGSDLYAHTYVTGPPLHLARMRGHGAVEAALIEAGSPTSWEAPAISETLGKADPVRGAFLGQGCKQCHGEPSADLEAGATAPNLFGVVGRNAGGVPGYEYSPYLVASGVTWTPDVLSSYLASPFRFLPGTKKYPTEIRAEQDRLDLIAYLITLSE